jgi:hypothetical protein
MEQDNQQFSNQNLTPPTHLSTFSKIAIWIFSAVVVLCIIIIGIMSWLIVHKNNTKTVITTSTGAQTVQVPQKSTPVPTDLKITFPKILTMTPLLSKNVPAYIMLFNIKEATEQTYNTIQYSSKETGFQSTYMVPNATVVMSMSEFIIEFNSVNKSAWSLLDAKGTNLDGYFEFQHNTLTDEIRVTFSQNGKNVNVTIQSIQLKK